MGAGSASDRPLSDNGGMKPILLLALISSLSLAAEVKLGKPFTLTSQTPIATINANLASYTGKVIQIKGKVKEVCEKAGCWMMLTDPASGAALRIKVNDGVIVFPQEAVGKMAVAEGKLVKIELTTEQAIAAAQHEAEEQNRKFDPSSVTGPKTIYQIAGTGAVILE